MKSAFVFWMVLAFVFLGCSKTTEISKKNEVETEQVSERGLKVGETAPSFVSRDVEGKTFELQKEIQKGPVVLVFYRGGWCPYCNLQLRNLQAEALPKVQKAGGRLVVISVDKVDEALKTREKEKLGMTILSDPKADLLKSFSVDYKVPDELVKTYLKKYKLDLEAASGQKHHIIAVPSVFVISKERRVTFAYANEDYKVRAQIADIIEAVEKL